MRQLYYILVSMRPAQWTKNLVVFAALIFSRNLSRTDLVVRSVEAFLIFCLMSGVIYLINDVADAKKDQLHPLKRRRPLASGDLGPSTALGAAAVVGLAALYLSSRVGTGFLIVASAFCALNLVYSFILKRVVLLDVVSISLGFVLRAIGGVEAIRAVDPSIEISAWLLICTLFLSLFLSFCKRRHELVTMDEASNHRQSLEEYSPVLLDQLVAITAGGSVLAYAIYTIWPETVEKFGTKSLVYTVPLVLIGVMRYLYLVYSKEKGGSPSDLLLRERFLLVDVLAWIVLVVVILEGS